LALDIAYHIPGLGFHVEWMLKRRQLRRWMDEWGKRSQTR